MDAAEVTARRFTSQCFYGERCPAPGGAQEQAVPAVVARYASFVERPVDLVFV